MTTLGIVNLPLFMLAVFLLNVTPGPDTAYIVGRSVSQGRAAGLLSSLGVSAGCCVHVLAVAFGLTALLAASTVAFTVIKVVGAAYLIYLGGRMLLAPPERDDAPADAEAEAAIAKRPRPLKSLFMQGFLTNVLSSSIDHSQPVRVQPPEALVREAPLVKRQTLAGDGEADVAQQPA